MRMYRELAPWYLLVTRPDEYVEEAAWFLDLLRRHATVRTLLELGAGSGNLAHHWTHLDLTLTDLSAEMVAICAASNPAAATAVGDLRSLRLQRTFDAVFVHDAISYVTTEADLQAALATAYVHVRPGGVAVFVPDYVAETFEPGTDHGGNDGADQAVRYLEWVTDPDPADSVYQVDWAFLVRGPDGAVAVHHDQHQEGMFPRDTWLRLLREVGFDPVAVEDPWDRVVFVGVRR